MHSATRTRSKTMATLRVKPPAVSWFLTTLSVASWLSVGMRLVFGNISLFHYYVIMLAPEVFEPCASGRRSVPRISQRRDGLGRAAFDIIEVADDAARFRPRSVRIRIGTGHRHRRCSACVHGSLGSRSHRWGHSPRTVTAFAGPSCRQVDARLPPTSHPTSARSACAPRPVRRNLPSG